MLIQTSGPLPSHLPSRTAISALIPALQLRTRDSDTRVTPSADAASVTVTVLSPNTPSLRTSPGWGGRCIFVIARDALVIVLVVDERGILAFERKSKPPIAADSNGPMAGETSCERVQSPAWKIHAGRSHASIQRGELKPQTLCVSRLDSSNAAGREVRFKPLVSK